MYLINLHLTVIPEICVNLCEHQIAQRQKVFIPVTCLKVLYVFVGGFFEKWEGGIVYQVRVRVPAFRYFLC